MEVWAALLGLLILLMAGVGTLYAVACLATMPGTVEAGPFLSGARPREHAQSRSMCAGTR